MKILDRYILISFLKTFATVFVILFFIFILQGIWLFISELAGKDLDAWFVIKFLSFYSPTIVPLVLPLSILLASIMTFGNFAENYEFAAMKSSGISLSRAMRALMIFIFGLSIVAFFFANNVIPNAQYEFINLRKSIAKRKPAMAIVEGQFNAIGSFNIKVEKKSGDDGEKLQGVTIHKRMPNSSNATVIRSKTGLLHSSKDDNLLQLELFDGYYYEEINSKKPSDRNKLPFAKSSFTKQVMNIDLSVLNKDNGDNNQGVHTNNMLNITELNYTLDSLQSSYTKERKSITDNITNRINMHPDLPVVNMVVDETASDNTDTAAIKDSIPENMLSLFKEDSDRKRILEIASNNLNSTDFIVKSGQNEVREKIKNINGHWHALYEKFVIAFACILMFFIGAPLGAIIRKGGLGLPIVFAVLIFIIFHFINTFGKKLAQEDGIPPFLGAWMSSFVLSPLAVLLTYRATNDIGLINMDNVLLPLQKLFAKKKTEEVSPILELDTIEVAQDKEWDEMNNLGDTALIGIVKNAKQFNYSDDYRIKALKILDSRNITQEELLARGELFNAKYEELLHYLNKYKRQQIVVFITYILTFIFSGAAKNSSFSALVSFIIILLGLISMVTFYAYVIKSEKSLTQLGTLLNKKVGIGLATLIILGFPFYIFIYLYERKSLKEALSEFNQK